MELAPGILEGCISNNRKDQKELYLILLPYLRAVANRYLRNTSYEKDVLQESFVKIFKSINTYDSKKAPLKSWASRIIINTCLNYNERVIGAPTEELLVVNHEGTQRPTALEQVTDDKLLAILKKMPKGYFEVFNLFVIEGYNHKEIASFLGISEALSRKNLSRAKAWFQKAKPMIIDN